MMMPAYSEEKIGDGLYVAYDGEHYHLHVPRTANTIRLDNEAVRQFMLYVLRVQRRNESMLIEGQDDAESDSRPER